VLLRREEVPKSSVKVKNLRERWWFTSKRRWVEWDVRTKIYNFSNSK
jgi:hypothetical protein